MNIVESVLKQAIDEELFAEWERNEEMYTKMRQHPYNYDLEYKTYAWLLAFDGNSTLWNEKINIFDEE